MFYPKDGTDLVRAAGCTIPGIHSRGVPATVHSTADLTNPDDHGAERSLFGGDLEYPLRNPFRLAVAVDCRRLRGRWPFRDKSESFRHCWKSLEYQTALSAH